MKRFKTKAELKALKQGKKGREMTEAEVKALQQGDLVWIYWSKDDNPDYVRWNEVCVFREVESSEGNSFHADNDLEDWPYDGDTSRGCARYFKVE